MSDNPAQQFTNRAEEHAQKKREEYDRMMPLLQERVEEMNGNRGDLPEIVMKGSSLHLDQFTLHLEFDQLFPNPSDYVLVLRVGQPKKSLFGSEPVPVRYKLRPVVSNDRSSVLWAGNVQGMTQFSTAGVVELRSNNAH